MFSPQAVSVLTSTASTQTVTVPAGNTQMTVINAAANPLYLKFAASVAVPTTFASGEGMMVVPASSTATFPILRAERSLSYIAVTAGGALTISVGVDV